MRQRPRRHGDENLPRGVQRIFHTTPERSVIGKDLSFLDRTT
jgi:hypothetical protein